MPVPARNDRFFSRAGATFADEVERLSGARWVSRGDAVVADAQGRLGSLVGKRIALEAAPSVLWSAIAAAILRRGATLVPIPLGAPAFEVDHILADAEVALHLGVDLAPGARTSRSGIPFVDARAIDPRATRALVPEPIDEDLPAAILYTSGTTGRPKGVPLTLRHLDAQIAAVRGAWAMSADDTLLHCLPTHHLHGFVVAFLSMLESGGSTCFLPRFDPRAIAGGLPHATMFMGVPTMFQRLVEAYRGGAIEDRDAFARASRALRLVTSGSAALPASLAQAWAEIAGVVPLERYGMTEIGIAISNPLDPAGRRPGAVGRPVASIDARIVDDRGVDCASMGELWIRGPGVFEGYLGRPDDTRAAFREGGFFATGDVASRDADGVVSLHGRNSVDILKTGGEKVSALEIEQVLLEHPMVREVSVVGLPDEVWGDRVIAVVVTAERATFDEAELKAFVKSRLAHYKVPKAFVAWERLPRNTMGKVVKPEVVRALRHA
jgi:malonyl-CoA/methylmalonyl-CoA synthetase